MIIELRDRRGGRSVALFDDGEPHVGGRMFINKDGYAYRRKKIGGRVHEFSVARLILGLAKGDPREADHINRERLDNRRSNLRIVTDAQQHQNQGKHRIHLQSGHERWSGERGVHWHAQTGRWVARITIGGKRKHLGYHNDVATAAAIVRDERKRWMPFAVDYPGEGASVL